MDLAYKTFYNKFIFKYTHVKLSYNVVYYIMKKHNCQY
jgi:hypothetical protein